MQEFAKWDTFYVIIGSAAGALIGLQFVVMTLVAQRPSAGGADAGAAFATPTVVHFTSVLFLSALLRAPWQRVISIAIVWGLIGLQGVVYSIEVGRRMRKQSVYVPVFEDWLFHLLLPLVAYGILAFTPFGARSDLRMILFLVAAAALLLLYIGIHNTWDGLSYHVFVTMRKGKRAGGDESSKPGTPPSTTLS